MSFGARIIAGIVINVAVAAVAFAQATPKGGDPEAAKVQNPIATSPDSIAKGKAVFLSKCAPCHGPNADGTPTIMLEGGVRPANLTHAKYTYGTSDGEVFTNIKNGILPDLNMPTWDGQISDNDIWNIVNFLKTVRQAQ
jgi:mono/diheme cytochrome c family protein